MKSREVTDGFGRMKIPEDHLWGAQTQRSLENFSIGNERIPMELIRAYALIKRMAAAANQGLGLLDDEKYLGIKLACMEIYSGRWNDEFPLAVWQTGSGTHTNMNMNEVIANLVNQKKPGLLHPNDDVNMGQSTNDTFPTAMQVASVLKINTVLIPTLDHTIETLQDLEFKYKDIIKVGRTHLQDATPVTFGQEISGWREMISQSKAMIQKSVEQLIYLPIGGTAVGTGLNSSEEFSGKVIAKLNSFTGVEFKESPNKFYGLSSKDSFVFAHGALKALAANLLKLANDVRWLASGPRAGLGEINIPANEPGSSIMPGKVNPTQAEALAMVCTQVMGNDTTIGIAASQGNFELNVYMPVIIYNFMQSVNLLNDSLALFTDKCLAGITVNEVKMEENVENSLMLVTALSPHIGYDKASRLAKVAFEEEISLKEAAIKTGCLTEEEFDKLISPEDMI
ncbi:class II fumarate hydratase [Alkalibacterium subtropicum]|uniref:class II fumarate hydratase n=1 Tax=Alkalibacterium subtropicum TaxID=753702 RepID=UPI001C42E85C|nr:class II fumarate hydratase [Alkalibacterium subtropicum]